MTDETKTIREQVEARVEAEKAMIKKPDDEGGITPEFIRQCLNANELGDGVLYATLFRDKYVFVKNTQEWFKWMGHFWQRDIMGQSLAGVERVVDKYLEEYRRISGELASISKSANGDDNSKDEQSRLKIRQSKLWNRAAGLRGDRRRTACLKFAHTVDDPLAIAGEEMDCRPMLLPCQNGVIDLETGLLIPGRPGDYLSLASPIPYLGIDTPAPLWEKTIMEIFNGNEEIVTYIQRLFGYAMTGIVNEKVFPVLYGRTGWNGRSLIIETISRIMGSLAGKVPAEMLLAQKFSKSGSGPSPDIMSLKGIRAAFASETDETHAFSAAKIKWLTGKDELVGRSPHDKYLTRFAPTHKLFLQTNTLPSAPANDKSFWERLHVIPFKISFVNRDPQESYERRAILNLDQQVIREAPGILAWLVKGCLLWQRDGLRPPLEIIEEGKKYQQDEDLLADFIDECCIREPAASEKASYLYTAFVNWYHANHGKKEPSGSRFGKWMAVKFDKHKSNGCIVYQGIRLNAYEGDSA